MLFIKKKYIFYRVPLFMVFEMNDTVYYYIVRLIRLNTIHQKNRHIITKSKTTGFLCKNQRNIRAVLQGSLGGGDFEVTFHQPFRNSSVGLTIFGCVEHYTPSVLSFYYLELSEIQGSAPCETTTIYTVFRARRIIFFQ